MEILVDVILKAGRSAVELSLFILLPVMVVMLSLMRLLEAKGVLDWLVTKLAPLLKPFGLTGLGVFASLQISFVSFAGPIATLKLRWTVIVPVSCARALVQSASAGMSNNRL